MQFPKDAVLVKTISLDVDRRTRRRSGGSKRKCCTSTARTGAATPTPGATTRPTPTSCPRTAPRRCSRCRTRDSSGGKREQVWTFHSRTQCISCHNAWSEYALGVQPAAAEPGPGSGEGAEPTRPARPRGLHPAGSSADDKPLPPFDEQTAAKEPALADPSTTRAARSTSGPGATCTRTAPTATGSAAAAGRSCSNWTSPKPLKETGILDVPPQAGRLRPPGRPAPRPGRPGPQRAVLPDGEVRPRPDAAPRLGVPGPRGLDADRASGSRRWADRRRLTAPPTTATELEGASTTPTRATAMAGRLALRQARSRRPRCGARGRRASCRRAGPRPVRGLPAARPEGPQARPEPAAGGDPRPDGRREARRGDLLHQGDEVRQLPQGR